VTTTFDLVGARFRFENVFHHLTEKKNELDAHSYRHASGVNFLTIAVVDGIE
jgi:hypothetical protein